MHTSSGGPTFVGETRASSASYPKTLERSVLKKTNPVPTETVAKESTLKVALGGWVSLFDKLYALVRKS